MANLASLLVGPLAGPECRRALGRGWLIVVRVLGALAMMGAALIVFWVWWAEQGSNLYYLPYFIVRWGLTTLEGMLLTISLVLGPAVLAGSIAGEKERGVMALLLTTRVAPREIILGRLTGKLTQAAMVMMAGLPAVVALGSLAGLGPVYLAVLLGLPAAVALGGGGLAVLSSTLSRRGRDALLTVYLLDVLFLLSPLGASRRLDPDCCQMARRPQSFLVPLPAGMGRLSDSVAGLDRVLAGDRPGGDFGGGVAVAACLAPAARRRASAPP